MSAAGNVILQERLRQSGIPTWYTGKTILITGGAGYLATNMVHVLQGIECTIVRLDRPGAFFEPVRGLAQVHDLVGDVRDPLVWEASVEPADIIFHFAAQTSTYVANADPPADLAINVLPLLQLMEVCRTRGWPKTLLFSSTVTVVGLPTHIPVDESFSGPPVTIYDLHKLMAEHYLKYYAAQGSLRGAILRLANVYGPGPSSSCPDRGVLNQMTRRAVSGEPLTVYGRGEQLRDYVHVEDVVMAFLQAAMHIDVLNGEHFIIGSGRGYSLAESMHLIAERVALKTGAAVPVVHVEPPSPQSLIESRNFVADSSRFSRLTGWTAHYALPEGIDQLIERLL
jgi:nucleoside-diphosphate-sugar epimerase